VSEIQKVITGMSFVDYETGVSYRFERIIGDVFRIFTRECIIDPWVIAGSFEVKDGKTEFFSDEGESFETIDSVDNFEILAFLQSI